MGTTNFFDFNQIPSLSKRDVDFQLIHSNETELLKYKNDISSFAAIIKDKSKENTNRNLLVKTLLSQAKLYHVSKKTIDHINLLSNDNCFTVTTAHQPSYLTGPLYFLYKILSTINLSEQLKKVYTDYSFVPVFVLGGEDHDFEEINHLNIFGKTFDWKTEENGAVGRMNLSSIKESIGEIYNVLGDSENAEKLKSIFNKALTLNNYGEFIISIVYNLFTQYGLVCLSMDEANLKKEMIHSFQDELEKQSSKLLVNKKQNQIDYPNQVHARDINLFYLNELGRNRIVFEDDKYVINNTKLTFKKELMIQELHTNPERFSPNVILRPLYQETILPNLCYVGGGGELAYWTELRDVFKYHKINFPMLLRRDSLLIVDKKSQKLMSKLDLKIEDVWRDKEEVKNLILKESFDYDLQEERSAIESIFDQLTDKVNGIDQSLSGLVQSTKSKELKAISNIESKLKKAIKTKEEIRINQVEKLWAKLYPKTKLQERYDNFIPFYLDIGDDFMKNIKLIIDPLDKRFKVIIL